jgi:dTDP-4-dehydrorhamnose reductase
MRILVTGGEGQLGSAVSQISGEFEVIPIASGALDITSEREITSINQAYLEHGYPSFERLGLCVA